MRNQALGRISGLANRGAPRPDSLLVRYTESAMQVYLALQRQMSTGENHPLFYN